MDYFWPLGSIPIRPAALQGGPARPLARPSIQRNCADAWGRLCVRSQNQDTKKERQNAQQESEKQARGRTSAFGGSCLPVFLNIVCGSCRPKIRFLCAGNIGEHVSNTKEPATHRLRKDALLRRGRRRHIEQNKANKQWRLNDAARLEGRRWEPCPGDTFRGHICR